MGFFFPKQLLAEGGRYLFVGLWTASTRLRRPPPPRAACRRCLRWAAACVSSTRAVTWGGTGAARPPARSAQAVDATTRGQKCEIEGILQMIFARQKLLSNLKNCFVQNKLRKKKKVFRQIIIFNYFWVFKKVWMHQRHSNKWKYKNNCFLYSKQNIRTLNSCSSCTLVSWLYCGWYRARAACGFICKCAYKYCKS